MEEATEGDEITLVLENTPFYAESGGQVGDSGELRSDLALIRVTDCKKLPTGQILHICRVERGYLANGDKVSAQVDIPRRQAIMRNHTAAHLLQAAMRKLLGDHVHQAGQLVDEHRVRFDFSHFAAVTPDELVRIEAMVNEAILADLPVVVREMPIAEAKEKGAMALFGEKYGDIVRVVEVEGFSTELCGGTHVSNTAKIGLFHIVSEASVAAGVRRIEAVTGTGVLALLAEQSQTLNEAAATLKLNNPAELVGKTHQLTAELKEKDREIERLNQKFADMQVKGMFENATHVGTLNFFSATFASATVDALRTIADGLKEQAPNGVGAISCVNGEKAVLIVCCGKNAVAKGMHAGKIIKEALAVSGGSGGGKPDMAMGGTPNIFRIDESMAAIPEIMRKMMKE